MFRYSQLIGLQLCRMYGTRNEQQHVSLIAMQ